MIKLVETPMFDEEEIFIGYLVKFNTPHYDNTTGVVVGYGAYGRIVTIETIDPSNGKRVHVDISALDVYDEKSQIMLLSHAYFNPKVDKNESV